MPVGKFALRMLGAIQGWWRKTKTVIGDIRLLESLKTGWGRSVKFIVANKGLIAAGAGIGTAGVVGYALSRHEQRVLKNYEGTSDEEQYRKIIAYRNNVVRNVSNMDPDRFAALTRKEQIRTLVTYVVSSTDVVSSEMGDDAISDFTNLLLLQVSLLRNGYSLRIPDDFQHLEALLEDIRDDVQFQYGIDAATAPIAIGLMDKPEIAIDDVML
jgi:hypothetical protein